MARILGLDLGAYSIKALVTDTGAKGAAARTWVEVPRPAGEDRLESLRAGLQELLGRLPAGHVDQVMVSLPGPALATHVVSLPFSDPKRIDATLPYEVESQLPFDLSEVVFDYQQVGGTPDKKVDLLVGVVRRQELADLLDVLREFKLDPRVVTHPAVTYQNLLALSPSPLAAVGPTESVAIVDLGHERTSVAVGTPGSGLEAGRTFSGGGKDLTRALAQEFHLTPEDAQAWKEQHGALASAAVGPDAERAAGALARGLQPILRELRPTLKAHAARTRKTVTRVYVCGGSGQLPGLDEQLTRDLGIPVERLPLPEDVQRALPQGTSVAAAQTWALALRGQPGAARAARFNLRRGEFAFKGDFDYLKGRVGLLAAYAATLLLLFIASGVVRNMVLGRREAQVDAQLCEVTKRVLGTCEKDYARALNLLAGQTSPTSAVPRESAVSLLAEVLNRVPTGVPVTFDQMTVNLNRIQLRGQTDTRTQVEDITTALKGYRCFKEVQPGKVEKAQNSEKTSFRLDIEVECPGEQATPQG